MIRIDTQGPVGDKFASWREKAEKARAEMIQEYTENGQVPDPERYQGIWRELKDLFLNDIFHRKCAFCEANLPLANFPPDVEHYRPKKRVTENRKLIDHPGYFWLACEWYNLVLVCRNCNSGHHEQIDGETKSHPGKALEFPVSGIRVNEPSADPKTWSKDLDEEKPLLLNPYFDRPEEHIAFTDVGVPYAKGDSERGEATIRTCHLDREGLCTARREFAEDLLRKRLHRMIEVPGTKALEPEDPFLAWLKHAIPMLMKDRLEKGGLKVIGVSAE